MVVVRCWLEFTTATWGWATDNADTIPFFLGVGNGTKTFFTQTNTLRVAKQCLNMGKNSLVTWGIMTM